MTLVRIVKNWDWPDPMRQTPACNGVWNGINFTIEPVEECDYLVMLNNCMEEEIKIICPRENIWALMQEPYMKGHSDWMVEGHENFSKVLTHHLPSDNPKYAVSHPAVCWHVNRTFDQLVSSEIPTKSKTISWIAGEAKDLPGHIKRWDLLNRIRQENTLDIDLFGRAVRYIEDKWDGLSPYKYSLAIENSSSPDYWTEKISDCFLAWTIPIYYGCTNLEDYFPQESFIRINIDRPEESVQRIKSIIKNDDWEKRMPAIEKARKLVLDKYQLFPHLSNLIVSQPEQTATKSSITIPAYKKSIKTRFYRALYKAGKILKRQQRFYS
jgi:hypothetical protein